MPFSAAILCGGLNSRMGGINKGFLHLKQESFLERLQKILSPLVSEIILVTKSADLYQGMGFKVVSDIYTVRSSLAGVHAALVQAQNNHVFLTACDAPLLKPELVNCLLESTSPEDEVVVPASEQYFEPLCAVYSKACLPVIETLLEQKCLKISNLFSRIRLKKISYQTLQQYDPELESFINVNNLQDLERVKILYRKLA
ncbi:MAG: molybdenum cofactor guanylyltransferase [Desulfohalobiaceae bacterium]|nr:molybdenum cofactor guanylyltransferase [Desulfohalobiaceae bacterium]